MLSRNLYDIVNGLAPFSLSAEYVARGARDNSGLLLDFGEVNGVLCSLDLSVKAAEEAKKMGADCVVTHHPAIWAPLFSISEENAPALMFCIKNRISVLSAHLNLDAAEGGIDHSLMIALGGKTPVAVMETLPNGGYGRVYDVPKKPLEKFVKDLNDALPARRTVFYGEREVKRVASFCGAGLNEGALRFAQEQGADTVVSSDAKHHLITAAAEAGLNLVLPTHYAAENYGFVRFAEKLKKHIGNVTVFTDERFL